MRHGSAIVEEDTGVEALPDAAPLLPEAQRLGRRLIAFARLAAAMHAEATLRPPPRGTEIDGDASLASMLGSRS
ncbi:MAG: hypothetical protein JNK58_09895 [Phycisphaerae bacterium]|nr:hypothetical protein [Phycisphaerae bacterium]